MRGQQAERLVESVGGEGGARRAGLLPPGARPLFFIGRRTFRPTRWRIGSWPRTLPHHLATTTSMLADKRPKAHIFNDAAFGLGNYADPQSGIVSDISLDSFPVKAQTNETPEQVSHF